MQFQLELQKIGPSNMTLFKYLVLSLILAINAINTAHAAEPMDAVVQLLDSDGGLRSGVNELQGYFVVSMAFGQESSIEKSKESARLDALKQLSEFIHGARVSGSSIASIKHVSSGNQEFSESYFSELVQTSFSGQLNAIKVLKQGKYGDQFFVALAITEQDTKISQQLNNVNESSLSTASDLSPNDTIENRAVEAKGIASLRLGTQEARDKAIGNALKNAVQQVRGVILKGSSGRFGDSITLAINSKTKGYVREYELIEEKAYRGDYTVMLVAEIDNNSLARDLDLYVDMFSAQNFYLNGNDPQLTEALKNSLLKMGFNLTTALSQATYQINATLTQDKVVNHLGSNGAKTSINIDIINKESGELLVNVKNIAAKTKIYVQPSARAQQVSKHAALKQINKKLKKELITSLSRISEKGLLYRIEVTNANRRDLNLFRHVLEGASDGHIENWEFKKKNKLLILNFRFAGSLSAALDSSLDELYNSYKHEGRGRKPKAIRIGKTSAKFLIKA